MLSESLVLNLIISIYDAAGDPQLWPAFLEQFADAVGGAATLMFLYGVKGDDGNVAAAVRLDSDYIQVDQSGMQGSHLVKAGNVATGQMLCPEQVPYHSEFCNDFLSPMEVFHEFGRFIRKEQSVASIISSLRSKLAGPFEEEEIRLLSILMPHLRRGFQFHQRMVALQRRAESAVEALDRLTIGFLLVDGPGKILMLNHQAGMILDQNDGLAIRSETLHASRAKEANRLRGLIQQAMAAGSERGFESGMMTIPRPSERRAFEILVTPQRTGVLPLGLSPRRETVAIFLIDPENRPEPDDQVLVRLFGLTQAEARLAGALIQGKSLKQAAEEFCLSRNTVRSQLQSIFDKTGTTRQAELVGFLWNSIARLQIKSS